MSWAQLQAEYYSVGIGDRIFHEISSISRSLVSNYSPEIYGRVSTWAEGLEDLVQEFVLEVLIGEGQLDYVMLNCVDEEHFRRLLRIQIKRLLARRRTRTVVDNLLSRSKNLAASPPFSLTSMGSKWSYTLQGKQVEGRALDQTELLEAISLVQVLLPRTTPNPQERAPSLLTDEQLSTVLAAIADFAPCPLQISDVDQIFGRVFTFWIPRILGEEETVYYQAYEDQLTQEDQRIVEEAVASMLADCSAIHRKILLAKLNRVSDTELAAQTSLSRPTVAKRKQEARSIVKIGLGQLTDRLRLTTLDRLVQELSDLEEHSI